MEENFNDLSKETQLQIWENNELLHWLNKQSDITMKLTQQLQAYKDIVVNVDKAIEKYRNRLLGLTLIRGIDATCNIHNAETKIKSEIYFEITNELRQILNKEENK